VSIDADVEATARKAQRELARVGHHRLPPIDLMIAACAHEAAAGVLHYDRDYDVIAELTSLRFESVWVAPSGTL
jgi:predicted nucleic acid-binding protein